MKIKCLICGKELIPCFEKEQSGKPWMNTYQSGDCWKIGCNYGSKFDTQLFVFGLCDSCIQDKQDDGLLIANGNSYIGIC